MSVEVIKRRNKHEVTRYREFDCGKCGSTLRIDTNKHLVHGDQRDGDHYIVRCPICEKESYVNA